MFSAVGKQDKVAELWVICLWVCLVQAWQQVADCQKHQETEVEASIMVTDAP